VRIGRNDTRQAIIVGTIGTERRLPQMLFREDPMAAPTKEEIIALERDFWEAMKRKDGKRAAELTGKSALVTGAHGVMSIPRARMGAMTEESNWTLDSYDFKDIEVVTPTPDVAIIAYTARQDVTMDGEKKEIRAADSSTWIRGTNGWECHAHSEAFLK
jgi:hypothetical protein